MTVPVHRWKGLLQFASEAGIGVAFGLNVMYGRNCTTRCANPSNAIALVNLTASLGYGVGKGIGAFEVGNKKEHV